MIRIIINYYISLLYVLLYVCVFYFILPRLELQNRKMKQNSYIVIYPYLALEMWV